jgi:hypothetical protein
MKLYIAYGTEADQVIALRLQALAAVNGLGVYVPPAYTRRPSATTLEPQALDRLMESDVVLGVITTGISNTCRQELDAARAFARKKDLIVLADPAVALELQDHFPGKVVVIDPANPAQAEQQMVQYLKQTEIEQTARAALIALGTLALGLMLFAPQE